MSAKVILKKKTSLISPPTSDSVVVTCPAGAEKILARELGNFGFSDVRSEGSAIRVSASAGDLPLLNRYLRTASRVLVPIERFDADTYDHVYEMMKKYPWERLISPEHTFMIVANTRSQALRDHRFLAMRAKDAIVDRQREFYGGRRSSIAKDRPHLVLNVFADERSVEIALDSTGDPLHQRGYRTEAGNAPLRETVAAQLVLESGYTDTIVPLLDPFCGSGTVVIEAALIGSGRGPGTMGRRFAYQRWPWWDAEHTGEKQPAPGREGPRAPVLKGDIQRLWVGTDNDPSVIDIARRNAQRAGVADLVHFEVADFRESVASWTNRLPDLHTDPAGIIATNPPYGVRLRPEDLSVLYSDLGDQVRANASGWVLTILAAETAPIDRLGLRPDFNVRSHNGSIPCRLMQFRVFSGDGRKNTKGTKR